MEDVCGQLFNSVMKYFEFISQDYFMTSLNFFKGPNLLIYSQEFLKGQCCLLGHCCSQTKVHPKQILRVVIEILKT